jgi:fluoride exporter
MELAFNRRERLMAPTTKGATPCPLPLRSPFGGAFGVLGRYGLDSLIEHHTESSFPLATFTINVSGCLAVGFIIAALVDRHSAPQWLRAGLVIGFCGGFTTFSTFAQENFDYLQGNDISLAFIYAIASVVLGILAVTATTRQKRALCSIPERHA